MNAAISARPLRLLIISASVRDQGASTYLLPWLHGVLEATPGVDVDVIDLSSEAVPDGREIRAGGSDPTHLTDRLAAADGYVVLTPEYNHSYPGDLKRLLDHHFGVWAFKPATVVSYGVFGGLLATEHLRGVFAEMQVNVIRRVVGLSAPWEHVDEAGVYRPDEGLAKAVDRAVDELVWWADLLRGARETRELPG